MIKIPGGGVFLVFKKAKYRSCRRGTPVLFTYGRLGAVNEPRVVRLTHTNTVGKNTVKAADRRATASEEEPGRVIMN